jgi:hypothetical protein
VISIVFTQTLPLEVPKVWYLVLGLRVLFATFRDPGLVTSKSDILEGILTPSTPSRFREPESTLFASFGIFPLWIPLRQSPSNPSVFP